METPTNQYPLEKIRETITGYLLGGQYPYLADCLYLVGEPHLRAIYAMIMAGRNVNLTRITIGERVSLDVGAYVGGQPDKAEYSKGYLGKEPAEKVWDGVCLGKDKCGKVHTSVMNSCNVCGWDDYGSR